MQCNVQCTCGAYAVHMPCPPSAHPVHMRCTCACACTCTCACTCVRCTYRAHAVRCMRRVVALTCRCPAVALACGARTDVGTRAEERHRPGVAGGPWLGEPGGAEGRAYRGASLQRGACVLSAIQGQAAQRPAMAHGRHWPHSGRTPARPGPSRVLAPGWQSASTRVSFLFEVGRRF